MLTIIEDSPRSLVAPTICIRTTRPVIQAQVEHQTHCVCSIERRALAAAAAAWFALSVCHLPAQPASGDAQAGRRPVLVELFTSEGCSSCPPADELLANLDAAQFVPAARAIVLSEHVTYWNHEGWIDPFSSQDMTDRQQQYAEHFKLSSTYTPQIVVDGAEQFVGSDSVSLTRALAKAAEQPKPDLRITDAHLGKGNIQFSIRVPAGIPAGARVFGVLAIDSVQSKVTVGENAGRLLHHVAVVRVVKEFHSDVLDARPIELSWGALSHPEKAPGQIRLVVFLADRKSGRVIAVTEQSISR